MSAPFLPARWYWTIGAAVYSSASATVVDTADAAYVAWLAAGGVPSVAASSADLDATLAACGLPPSGLTPPTKADLVAAANAKVATLRAVARAYDLGGSPDVSVKADAITDTIALVDGLAQWGGANPAATTAWTDDLGLVTTITGAQAVTLKTAGLAYLQALFAVLGTACTGVAAGSITTTAGVDALAWPT